MSPTSREWQSLAEVKQDGEWYIASIPPLDLSSQGRSPDEAIKNLQEAFTLFVESCRERGVLQKVLAGFRCATFAAVKMSHRRTP